MLKSIGKNLDVDSGKYHGFLQQRSGAIRRRTERRISTPAILRTTIVGTGILGLRCVGRYGRSGSLRIKFCIRKYEYAVENADVGREMVGSLWHGRFRGRAGVDGGYVCVSTFFAILVADNSSLNRAEIGVNPSHILAKSLTVLNPLKRVDEHIMDDADLAGPLVFCFAFALVLLFVGQIRLLGEESADDNSCQSGKPQFSYIYGVAALGTTAIYLLLNVMSETGIDAYRTASVLGYCLLPMVGLGGIGMAVGIE